MASGCPSFSFFCFLDLKSYLLFTQRVSGVGSLCLSSPQGDAARGKNTLCVQWGLHHKEGINSEIMKLAAYIDSWHFGPFAFLEMEIEMFALACKQILSLEEKERSPLLLK